MNRQHTRGRLSAPDRALCAPRGPTSRFPRISLSAFPAKAMRISKPPWRWCARSNSPSAFSFKYSPRPGTPAAAAKKQVAEDVKTERLQALQALLLAAAGRRQSAPRSARPCRCCSKSRAARKASWSAARPICSRCMSKALREPDRHHRAMCGSTALTANSLQGALAEDCARKRGVKKARKVRQRTGHAGICRQQAAGRAGRPA